MLGLAKILGAILRTHALLRLPWHDQHAWVATALTLSAAEQEFDEATAQIRALRRGGSRRREQRPFSLIGVNDGGLGDNIGFVGCRLSNSEAEKGCAGKERKMHSVGHRRTRTVFVVGALYAGAVTGHRTAKIENRIGLVNGIGVSI